MRKNEMYMSFLADSVNESLARITVAAFAMELNPTMEEIEDIRTSVSEAVTNDRLLHIEIKDNGKGIPDVEKAKQPFYTTKPECERSGMGFAFMEAFMDSVKVESELHIGTRITMEKEIGKVEDE